ncbi:MAG: cytochrome b, partial [Sciscionella sp.]
HVLIIPGLILGLISAHMLLLVYQKHTQWAGPGRTNKNVVGYPLMPIYMAKAGGFFFIIFGLCAVMGATLQINPIWMYGPYTPNQVTADAQPDWYMGWLEGALRIMPNWETRIDGFVISWNVFIPGVAIMGVLFTLLAIYPFLERWISGDIGEHHLLDRPRNQPTRTGLGVAGITAYGLLWLAGGNDVIATHFHISLNAITWMMRFLVFVGPVLAFIIARRWAISLQRQDRGELLHGYETGVLVRSPEGGYSEIHAPLSPEHAYTITARDRRTPLELPPVVDESGVKSRGNQIARVRARLHTMWFGDEIQTPTTEELEQAHRHAEEEEEPLREEGLIEQADHFGIESGGQIGGDDFELEEAGEEQYPG